MTIEQLKYFLTVEKYSSFSEAAYALFITQSALSKQIKGMEKELGFPLFERSTRKIRITNGGKVVFTYANRILSEYHDMQNQVRTFVRGKNNIIRVVSIPVLTSYDFLTVFQRFQKSYPSIQLSVEERDPDIVFRELQKGDADVAILRSNFPLSHQYQVASIITDEMVLLVNRSHPFASRGEISLREAANESFFLISTKAGLHDFFVEACERSGFFPKIKQDDLSRWSIKSILSAGEGVSLMMKRVANEITSSSICSVTLQEHPMLDIVAAVNQENMDSGCASFIGYIKDSFRTPENDLENKMA